MSYFNIASYYKKKEKKRKMVAEIITNGIYIAVAAGVVFFGLAAIGIGIAIIIEVFN